MSLQGFNSDFILQLCFVSIFAVSVLKAFDFLGKRFYNGKKVADKLLTDVNITTLTKYIKKHSAVIDVLKSESTKCKVNYEHLKEDIKDLKEELGRLYNDTKTQYYNLHRRLDEIMESIVKKK